MNLPLVVDACRGVSSAKQQDAVKQSAQAIKLIRRPTWFLIVVAPVQPWFS